VTDILSLAKDVKDVAEADKNHRKHNVVEPLKYKELNPTEPAGFYIIRARLI
jgi:hypothetical protein